MLELKIMVDDKGMLSVDGPIEDKVLSYGLLESARDVIADHHRKKAASPIVAAPASALSQLGGTN